jgi:hypothetical protein
MLKSICHPTQFALLVLGCVCCLAFGCETTGSQSQRTYQDLMKDPLPTNNAERDSQCAWIRSEIARMESIAQAAAANTNPNFYGLVWQAKARDNIAALRSRYSQIQCDVMRVAPASPVTQPSKSSESREMDFDQCYAKCRDLTGRTEGECFDACNK